VPRSNAPSIGCANLVYTACQVDRYRFILGSVIVLALLLLAIAIALGKVEEKTSYGLVPVVTILAKVALDFSEWAFRSSKDSEKLDGPPA